MRALIALVFAFAFAPAVSGQVYDGQKFKCGPHGLITANVEIVATPNEARVSFTRDGADSNTATGTPENGGVDECGEMEQENPAPPDGDGDKLECRVDDGDWQYKNDNGDWVDAGSPRKRTGQGGVETAEEEGGPNFSVPGEEVTGLPSPVPLE